jgi:hypothetical protein
MSGGMVDRERSVSYLRVSPALPVLDFSINPTHVSVSRLLTPSESLRSSSSLIASSWSTTNPRTTSFQPSVSDSTFARGCRQWTVQSNRK